MKTVKIEIPLTVEEHAALSAKQATKQIELGIVLKDKKKKLDRFNAQKATLEAELVTLAEEERSGVRRKDCSVLEKFDWDAGKVYVSRADTGEDLPEFTRDITLAEKGARKQGELALDGAAATAPLDGATAPLDPVTDTDPAPSNPDDDEEAIVHGTEILTPGAESEGLPAADPDEDDDSDDEDEDEEDDQDAEGEAAGG